MNLTQAKCDQVNAIERNKDLAWVDQNIRVPLTAPQKVGIASCCPYNIGPGQCFPSTVYRKMNAGYRKVACSEIRSWISCGRSDLRPTKDQKTGGYGQVERRDQERALTPRWVDT
ncbi:lysozyme [Klebsiella pneumoniae]|nr:lysozyme [Klebsiella pneumoniae]